MTTRVEKLLLSLQVGFDDGRMIGITGLGGAGKTTLAGVVFNRIANQFDGKTFVQNVRERSQDSRGLQDMQKQILTSVFSDQSIAVPSDFEGRNMMKRRMPSIKVLIVLDDVNDMKQLEALAEPSWFKPGSRIIITSRDKHVLVAHGVQSHNIHDVSTLSDEDAIRLLSKYAFKTESPAHGYEELSKKVVRYAAGLPLTIKTLSSSLHGCPVQEWEDAIKRLETIPWGDTLNILKVSYDALEEDLKEIFLHVACLLKGLWKKRAIRILESLGFRAKFGLGILEQKSLIILRDSHHRNDYDYDNDEKELDMHDHIEEMGMHIVRSLHPDEPQQHKLLWIRDEIEDIIEKDMGTKAIRGIKLVETDLPPAKISQSLRKMSRLCFLHVEFLDETTDTTLIQSRSNYSRYLPNTFQGDNLVGIYMPDSSIRQLWKGGEKKVLPKLKLLNLSGSKLKTFDSAMTPNLEALLLRECEKLVEVNISAECSHVKRLDVSKCTALEKLTISNECQNLDELELDHCESLRKFQLHVECPRLRYLFLYDTKLCSFNLGMAPNLERLSVYYCKYLKELVIPVECGMLTHLYLNNNNKLRSFNLGMAPNLEVLEVEYCKELEELVMPVECPMLTKLSLFCINKLRSLNLGPTPSLELLSVEFCTNLEELVMPVECPMLTKLSLNFTKLRSLNLGMAPNLEVLSVKDCEEFEELVMPVNFPMLRDLALRDTKLRSFNLGLTPNLEKLLLKNYEDFEEVLCMPFELPRLRVLSLHHYKDEHYGSFSYLPEKLKSLEKLRLRFGMMKRLPDSIYMLKHHLTVLDLGYCRKLEELPEDLDRLECLEELILQDCRSLRSIPDCICNMTRLKILILWYCSKLEELPDEFRCLQSLKVLDVKGIADRLKNLPESISHIKNLEVKR
uniref:disease resistance protein RUN1-like n=1 Tax=Erigeron canadensis TaxID=72917 RepID=UPI001CB99609|nr:disease resistance protein RUN1-like [Erigeron canadensis]